MQKNMLKNENPFSTKLSLNIMEEPANTTREDVMNELEKGFAHLNNLKKNIHF